MDETGIKKLTPGFVWMRVHREGKSLEDIVGQPLQNLDHESGQKQLVKKG